MSNPDMFEALQALAADKGISVDTLMSALADALESAYKRMPGAYEYAWVTIDPGTFDIRVYAQELDEEGEPVGDVFDVTPENFGRIAAQTARQVMTQRIREAAGLGQLAEEHQLHPPVTDICRACAGAAPGASKAKLWRAGLIRIAKSSA